VPCSSLTWPPIWSTTRPSWSGEAVHLANLAAGDSGCCVALADGFLVWPFKAGSTPCLAADASWSWSQPFASRYRGRMRLLEREVELAALGSALESAREGGGRLIVVEGAAGNGESALLAASVEQAGRYGLRVLRARGSELERGLAFGAVRQLFEPVATRMGPLRPNACSRARRPRPPASSARTARTMSRAWPLMAVSRCCTGSTGSRPTSRS
jgi:hypothetical protein